MHVHGRAVSPEQIQVARFRAVSRRLREQATVWRRVKLRGAGQVSGPSWTCGGRRGTGGSGGLQGASVGGLVGRNCIVSPERTRTGGARRVRAGGLAVASLSLAAGFSLVVAVCWGHRGKKTKTSQHRNGVAPCLEQQQQIPEI